MMPSLKLDGVSNLVDMKPPRYPDSGQKNCRAGAVTG